MKHLIYKSPHATAWLTTEHANSSYGQPVLLIRLTGQAKPQPYGPADCLPSGMIAGELVALYRRTSGQAWFSRANPETLELARRFCDLLALAG